MYFTWSYYIRKKANEANVVIAKKLPAMDDELVSGAGVGTGAGELRRSRETVRVGFTTERTTVPSAFSPTVHDTDCCDRCST
mmetsp:Transcript_15565/g.23143  ORF Transcript_15565/g.23143 Transcript_15565/m.23143 type:complete len:82 (+) Transcript_15565:218-463(+)